TEAAVVITRASHFTRLFGLVTSVAHSPQSASRSRRNLGRNVSDPTGIALLKSGEFGAVEDDENRNLCYKLYKRETQTRRFPRELLMK
ncbi:9711_t:CDS:2, partial [Paraglomus occultum]